MGDAAGTHKATMAIGGFIRSLRRPKYSQASFALLVREDENDEFSEAAMKKIENGSMKFPRARAAKFASVLSTELAPWLDQARFKEAVSTAVDFDDRPSRDTSGQLFEWNRWLLQGVDLTVDLLKGVLHVTAAPPKPAESLLKGLSPVQVKIVRDLASNVRLLGNPIVSDDALESWEMENADKIRAVHAVVRTLGSEFGAAGFDRAMARILRQKRFLGFRYLVIGGEEQVHQVQAQLEGKVSPHVKGHSEKRSTLSLDGKSARDRVSALLNLRSAPIAVLDDFCNLLSAEQLKYWDCLYFYDCEPEEGMLIGVFRRFDRNVLRDGLPNMDLGLTSWGTATPINEALPEEMFAPFLDLFGKSWNGQQA